MSSYNIYGHETLFIGSLHEHTTPLMLPFLFPGSANLCCYFICCAKPGYDSRPSCSL